CLTSIPFVVVCVFAFIVKRFRVFVRRFTQLTRQGLMPFLSPELSLKYKYKDRARIEPAIQRPPATKNCHNARSETATLNALST
ncbi:hypothetical protein ACJ8BR_00050, partial [Klebsiella pneumoniae]